MPGGRLTQRRRWALATVAVVATLVVPVALDHDSFPLSTYPMYSQARSDRVTLPTALGISDDGAAARLSLDLIGASDDPLVVAGELREAIARGTVDERCHEIARRVGTEGAANPTGERIVAVEIVLEHHDVVDQAMGDPPPLRREPLARCEVPGPT
ncbi:MAG: hypothetical protein JNK12_15010 [Acidimicrobiales bacterium]|nr:hypothetical protein [Acidimicrobiales bacterium]